MPNKKRKRNEENWQANLRKKAVNTGKKFTWKSRKGEEKGCSRDRKIGKRCKETCKKDCKKISDKDREMILKSFWESGEAILQRAFILDNVKAAPKARERKRTKDNKKAVKPRNRASTRIYQLPCNQEKVTVCSQFFLSTLCIDERRVRTAITTGLTPEGLVQHDDRGKHKSHYQTQAEEDGVVAHISKFKTVESHYVRKTATAQYLPEELSVKEMHRMYVEEHDGKGRVVDYKFYH